MSAEVEVTQRAEEVAEEVVSSANIVTNGGYYEIDIDAVSAVLARFEAETRTAAEAESARLIAMAVEALEAANLALPVLKNMLKTARLGKGANVAAEMLAQNDATLAALRAQAPAEIGEK